MRVGRCGCVEVGVRERERIGRVGGGVGKGVRGIKEGGRVRENGQKVSQWVSTIPTLKVQITM